uniref:Carboxylesterase type B domain-containing protein n=1 Tax=Globisporangium ultimum (strain ATCC 200006 / CBS 805.95 / DAOM BR144) TaxID=431595 RepID=K3WPQ5_GLOUD
MWKISAIGALLCILSGVTTTASAVRRGDQVCTLSPDNQCSAGSIKPSELDGSVLIYPGGKTRCAFDDFADPKGNFNTNKTYFFQVFPNQDQDKKKVMLFFQGGGACADDDTCNFSLQCSLGASPTFTSNAVPSSTGILNRTNTDNVFQDWNIIHIPYCTGDLHIGNAVHEPVDSAMGKRLGRSQCMGQNMSTHLNGYENSLSALKWALANYPNPEHLIIGGASAGSLAAQALSVVVADMWDVEKKSIRYSVLGDSYVGVLPEEKKPSGIVLDYFGTCDVELKVPAGVVSDCKKHTLSVTELYSSLIKQLPFSDWLFIDSKSDKTQRKFYALLDQGILGYPFTNLISGDDFFASMTKMIDAYKTVSSRISTFFVESDKHVYLAYENYGAAASGAGLLLGDFLKQWLLPHDDATAASTAPAASPETPASTPSVAPSQTPTPAAGDKTETPTPAAGSQTQPPAPAATEAPVPAAPGTTSAPTIAPAATPAATMTRSLCV